MSNSNGSTPCRTSCRSSRQSLIAGFIVSALFCGFSGIAQAEEFSLYSGRKEALLKPIVDDFIKETGIKVSVKYGKDGQLSTQLQEEKTPSADALIVSDATLLTDLASKGKTDAIKAAELAKLPANALGKDKSWVAISSRARVIIVNRTLVKPEDTPKSLFDLTDSKWAGKIASTGITQSSFVAQVATMSAVLGKAKTESWLKSMKENKVTWFDEHTQVRKAVGKGEFAVGLVNHYYGHLEKAEGSPIEIVYLDQDSKNMGTAYNYASLAKLKGARNGAAVDKFVSYLLKPEVQRKFAELNYEFPIVSGVSVKDGVRNPAGIHFSAVTIEQMAAERSSVIEMGKKIGL